MYPLLAYTSSDATYDPSTTLAAGTFLLAAIVVLATMILMIAAMWKVFAKAGQPGWVALVPILNSYQLLKIAGYPGWWVLLMLIPIVNIVIGIMVCLALARSFGRGPLFGIFGLIIFSGVGMLILAFGKDRYLGPGGSPHAVSGQSFEPTQPSSPTRA